MNGKAPWQESLRQALAGDLGAFDAIVERFQDGVVAIAVSALGSLDDAQDAAQEAFIQAWRDLQALRDLDSFPGWLARIARNRCRDLQRRSLQLARQHEAAYEALPAGEASDPLAQMSRSELRERVLAEVAALSEPVRVVTTLFYINGYSVNEVAQFLEVPSGTVKRRLHDARKRLQEGMIEMVRETLNEGKPGPELRAQVAAELRARVAQWDESMRRWQVQATADGNRNADEWARGWHDRRMADVRANAAQYGMEPDEELPRMLPEYWAANTFRDDMKDMPRRWGIPEGLDLVNLRDLTRETCFSPVTIRRWEDEGLPVLRYQPWVLYDRARVADWLAASHSESAQPITPNQARKPLLTVMEAVASGLATPENAADLYKRLGATFLMRADDPVWGAHWDALHGSERRANAAQYGLLAPTDTRLGVPAEAGDNVHEIRDLTRRLAVSPIDVARWTRQGMPCLRVSPHVWWDIRHVGDWLTAHGILLARYDERELDLTELFVCRAVAAGEAIAEEGYDALSGWYGVA